MCRESRAFHHTGRFRRLPLLASHHITPKSPPAWHRTGIGPPLPKGLRASAGRTLPDKTRVASTAGSFCHLPISAPASSPSREQGWQRPGPDRVSPPARRGMSPRARARHTRRRRGERVTRTRGSRRRSGTLGPSPSPRSPPAPTQSGHTRASGGRAARAGGQRRPPCTPGCGGGPDTPCTAPPPRRPRPRPPARARERDQHPPCPLSSRETPSLYRASAT